jgi:cell division transport system permease protein
MTSIHFRSALKHIRRSPFQALSAFFILTISFFVVTLIFTVFYSLWSVSKYFETRPQIIAFLKDEISEEQIFSVKGKLDSDERVSKVTYVTKEDALSIYKKATSENPLLTELISPSIFPASLEISLKDLEFVEPVIEEIKSSGIVDQVGFTAALGGENSLGNVIERLKTIKWYVNVIGGGFAAVLVGTSFMVLVVIIGMRMSSRRGEIEILNLIGAGPSFIKAPIVWEALIYSLGGAFFGWLLAFLLVLYGAPSIISYFGEIPILPRNSVELFRLFGIFLISELFVGFVLGISGSLLAISRVKRK